MVFQNYSLYPHLSVLDNIAFPLKMAKVGKAERHAKAKDLAKLVHVEDQLDKNRELYPVVNSSESPLRAR